MTLARLDNSSSLEAPPWWPNGDQNTACHENIRKGIINIADVGSHPRQMHVLIGPSEPVRCLPEWP